MKTIIKIVFASLLICIYSNINAQTAFTISSSVGTYSELTGDISLNNGVTWDVNSQFLCPLGFTFNYYGINVTDVAVGGFGFADNINYWYVFDMCGSYKMVDKGLADGTGISKSPISYLLTGSAGSRILKIQFKNASFSGSSNDYVNFQVWLYETSNKIDVVIGSSSITNPSNDYSGATGPHIGVAIFNSSFSALDYSLILKGAPSSPTPDNTWANPGVFPPFLSGTPANGQIYTFSPSSSGINETVIGKGKISIYPNPFDDNSIISFDLVEKENVSIGIYDLTSRKISSIYNGELNAGRHQYSVAENTKLSPGIYFATLTIGKEIFTQKLIVK